MAKAHSTIGKTVRDSKSGRLITVRGFGALKGRLVLDERIDLTKPIAEQSADGRSAHEGGFVRAKH